MYLNVSKPIFYEQNRGENISFPGQHRKINQK